MRLPPVTALSCPPPTPHVSVPLSFAHLPSYAPSTPERFPRSRSCGACALREKAWILPLEDVLSFPCVLHKVRNSSVYDSFTRVISARGRYLQETKGTAVS